MKKIEWSIGEKGADEVIKLNLLTYEKLVAELETCCANPYCNYPISNLRKERYAVPEVGEVCATCYGVYQTLTNMNPCLKARPKYFMDLHEEHKKEIKDFKRRRREMGE